jgi:hypothetical protein
MDDPPPAQPPRPGDPRDPGPRPPGRVRDGLWLGLALVLLGVTAVQLVALARALLTGGFPPLGTGGLFVGFALTVVWLLTIAWFALGAWRRTVWGCPFAHTALAPPGRRCLRHPLLDGPAPEPPGADRGPGVRGPGEHG